MCILVDDRRTESTSKCEQNINKHQAPNNDSQPALSDLRGETLQNRIQMTKAQIGAGSPLFVRHQ